MKIIKIIPFIILIISFGCRQRKELRVTGGGTAWAAGSFNSDGQRIFFTATSSTDSSISYTGGPETGIMLTGGNPACASCHGIDARGGRHVAGDIRMDAPDIRWSALTKMKQKEFSKEGKTPDNPEYTLADFKKEVVDGRELDGSKLDDDMPRWKMSHEDLTQLMDYLKSLNGQ